MQLKLHEPDSAAEIYRLLLEGPGSTEKEREMARRKLGESEALLQPLRAAAATAAAAVEAAADDAEVAADEAGFGVLRSELRLERRLRSRLLEEVHRLQEEASSLAQDKEALGREKEQLRRKAKADKGALREVATALEVKLASHEAP